MFYATKRAKNEPKLWPTTIQVNTDYHFPAMKDSSYLFNEK